MAREKQALAYLIGETPQAIGRQRAAIRRYAESEKLTLIDEFPDQRNAASRPGLGGLLIAVRDRKVKLVLIANVEALGDSLVEQHAVIGLIAHRGAKAVDCSTGEVLSRGGTGAVRLIRQTAAVVEELRRKTTAGRLREARKSGRKGGQKPYGAHPHERPIVDLIMQLRREQGWGVRRIANELNRRGIVNRAGGKWQPTAVQRVFDRHE